MQSRKRRGLTPDEASDRARSFWYVLIDVLHGAKLGTFEHEDGVVSISKREWMRTFYRSRRTAPESATRAWERFKVKVKQTGVSEESLDPSVLRIHVEKAGDAVFEKLGPPHPTKENRRAPEERGG